VELNHLAAYMFSWGGGGLGTEAMLPIRTPLNNTSDEKVS